MAIDIATARTEIAKLYIAAFNRVPDSAGLNFWVDSYVNKGQTLDQIANNFTNSTEYTTKYPSYQTVAEYVEAIYVNVFGRASDAAGKAYWEARLTTNSSAADYLTHGTLMNAMVAAAASNGSTDGQKLTNQATFAVQSVLDQVPTATATAQLTNITSDTATVTAATAAVASSAGTVAGQTYTLTTGADVGTAFTGTSGNDTFNALDVSVAGTSTATFTVGDTLNGGAGNDTFNLTQSTAIAAAAPTGATVTNIETANYTSGATITADVSGFTGLTAFNTHGVGGATVTAASTTDISVTDTAMNTTTDSGIAITGGKNVTATLTAANATTDGDGTAEIVVGSSTAAAAGTVSVNLTGKYVDGSDNTMSNIAVTGGTSVTVTTATGITAAQAAAQTTDASNNTITQSAVAVTGNSSTTAVTVNQAAAVVEVDSATVGLIGIKNGAVTIADANSASTTAAGTLSTVTLKNYGDSTVNSGALTTVNLEGTGGTFGITTGSLTTPAVTTLALNVNGLSYKNAGTNNAITVDADITTLNINSSTAASTVNNITASGATTVNVSGNAALTLTNNTFAAASAITVTNTAGATFGTTAIAANTTFTGGAGADSIILSNAFTKAITMGAGNDTVTYGGAASTATGLVGSVSAGEGTDTIVMNTTEANTVDASSVFNTSFTGFEVLNISNAHTTDADLDGINGVSTVILTAGSNAGTLTNLASNGTVNMMAEGAGALTVAVKSALVGATDVLNVNLLNTTAMSNTRTLTAANVETINIGVADAATALNSATGSNAVIHTMTLAATSATKITVSGNNGLTLTNNTDTAVTTFDASGVVANNTAATSTVAATTDTAANLAVSYTSANSTTTAAVSITGGAGNDTLTGNAAIDTINGGVGNDILKGEAGADVIYVGTGRDAVYFDSYASGGSAQTDSGTGASDTVKGFVMATAITTATDLFDASATTDFQASTVGGANASILAIDMDTDSANANQAITVEANATGSGQAAGVTYTVASGILTLGGTGASSVDTLGEWLTEAAAVAATDGDILAFQFGSDTYVFGQNGAYDVLVKLEGVTGAAALAEVTATTTGVANTIYYADIA